MELLERLFDDSQRALQAVIVERAKVIAWLEGQLGTEERKNAEGYERLRLELTIRELQLAMLKSVSDEEYAKYEREQIRSTSRWHRGILVANIVVAVLMFGATVAMAIATVGIWKGPPPADCRAPTKAAP